MSVIEFWKADASIPFKRKLIKVAIVFFILMVAFTILSRVTFNITAAQVKTTTPIQQKIDHNINAVGELKGKQELAISIQEGLAIQQVNVFPGETVIRDKTLLILDPSSLENAINTCRQELQNSAKDLEIEKNYSNQKQKKEELQQLLNLQANGGKVTIPTDGVITEVNVKAGDKTIGGGEVRYTDASHGLMVTVQFSEEDVQYLEKGGKVTVVGENGKSVRNGIIKNITIDSDSRDVNNVMIEVPGKKLKAGSMATVQVNSADKIYDTCIPREALHQDDSNSYYVYTLSEVETIIGKQLVAEKTLVKVVDKGDTLVAVEELGAGMEVVVDTSKELEDQCRVRRVEP